MPDEKKVKQYCAKVSVNEEEGTITAVISTDSVDRDGEVVMPKGMMAEAYQKNPVVQWAHNYSLPPWAKSLWLKKGRKEITAKIKKAPTPFADEIFTLYKGGFLSAFSIGFKPKTAPRRPTEDEIKQRPDWAGARLIFDEWELLEFSAVPVPANPEALARAVKSHEIELSDPMKGFLKMVDGGADDDEIITCGEAEPETAEEEIEGTEEKNAEEFHVEPAAETGIFEVEALSFDPDDDDGFFVSCDEKDGDGDFSVDEIPVDDTFAFEPLGQDAAFTVKEMVSRAQGKMFYD